MNVKGLKIIVILGPTASGKSELAIKIAKKIDGEIISADSRQIYRGLDIGSGKVSRDKSNLKSQISKIQFKNQKFFHKKIRHHLINVASPKRIFTVSQYQKLAKKALAGILKRGKIPIICGGTGLYIDSIIYNTKFPEVSPQPKLRKKLEKLSTEKLFEKLKNLDPKRAENIDKHNRRRLVRALEIILTTKKPIPKIIIPYGNTITRDSIAKVNYDIFKIGIKKPPEELKKLIAKRLKKRLGTGMIEEIKNLHQKQNLSWQRLDNLGLEYRYVSRYLRGLITKQEMIESILKESWRYAKRQMTWFKRDQTINWIKNEKGIDRLIKNFLN